MGQRRGTLLGLINLIGFIIVCTHGELTPLEQEYISLPSANSTRDLLIYYTSTPHLAGTEFDYDTALYTKSKFDEYGLESEIVESQVVLSYPLSRQLTLIYPNDTRFEAPLQEAYIPEDPTSNNTDAVPTFNGYSSSGNVTANLVYANYGTVEDFDYLDSQNISVQDRIVIVRYGRIFRGSKVLLAETRGAAGVIIYSDPIDDGYGPNITDPRPVYPEGSYRPATSVQRGSVMFLPICPGNPTTERFEAKCQDSSTPVGQLIPSIPVQPISYSDATPFLSALGGLQCPDSWQGSLPFSYTYGPSDFLVNLNLEMNTTTMPIWNVVGKLVGEGPQADQLVILGNHRDAWVFGAVDPSSGTSVLLETARTLSLLKQDYGWTPKRTIMFISWDAEEYGLIGSTTWGEDNADMLQQSAVLYLNVDVAVSPYPSLFAVSSTPSLTNIINELTMELESPNFPNQTLYSEYSGVSEVLGSGSDFTVFIDHLGIPSVDLGFNSVGYGVYHSIYDSFTYMDLYGDPTYQKHVVATQILGLLAYRAANDDILPTNYQFYGQQIQVYYETLKSAINASGGEAQTAAAMDDLNTVITTFQGFAATVEQMRNDLINEINAQVNINQDLQERTVEWNQFMMQIEKQFLLANGTRSRPWFKHLLQSPGLYDGYGSQTFPTVTQSVDVQDWTTAGEQLARVNTQFTSLNTFLENQIYPNSESDYSSTISSESSDDDSWKRGVIIGVLLGGFLILVTIITVVLGILWYRKKQKKGYEAL